MTGEPFQPVRLEYAVKRKAKVASAVRALRCVRNDQMGVLAWHYDAESAALEFGRPRSELPEHVHPIVIGRFRFPTTESMLIEVRSVDRAIAAARLFGPRIGLDATLTRVRIVNRFFEGSEAAGGLERLEALLDADVVRIDPADAEAALEAALAPARTPEEKRRAFEAFHVERRKRDVPLVEDFPLAPEEETAQFRDLEMTLRFRGLRAYEHWKGNTQLTLADVIHRVVEQQVTAR